jgi:hypothetical protein
MASDRRATTEPMASLHGARIVHVEAIAEPFKWAIVFELRGTDDGSGYLIVDSSDVHFNDGGDPDAWKERLGDAT